MVPFYYCLGIAERGTILFYFNFSENETGFSTVVLISFLFFENQTRLSINVTQYILFALGWFSKTNMSLNFNKKQTHNYINLYHSLGAFSRRQTNDLFVLRFYGPANPMGSYRARSVYLTTRLLGRLGLVHILSPETDYCPS